MRATVTLVALAVVALAVTAITTSFIIRRV